MTFTPLHGQPRSVIHLAQRGLYDKVGSSLTLRQAFEASKVKGTDSFVSTVGRQVVAKLTRNWRVIEKEVLLLPRGYSRTMEDGWPVGDLFRIADPGLRDEIGNHQTLYETAFFSWTHELTRNMKRALALSNAVNAVASLALEANTAGVFTGSTEAQTWIADKLTKKATGLTELVGSGADLDPQEVKDDGVEAYSSVVHGDAGSFMGGVDVVNAVTSGIDSTKETLSGAKDLVTGNQDPAIAKAFKARAQLSADLALLTGKLSCMAVQQITLIGTKKGEEGRWAAPSSIIRIGNSNLAYIAIATGIEQLAVENPGVWGDFTTRQPWMVDGHLPNDPRRPDAGPSFEYIRTDAQRPVRPRAEGLVKAGKGGIGAVPAEDWVPYVPDPAPRAGVRNWVYR